MKLDSAHISPAKALAGLLALALFACGAGCHRGQSDKDVMATVNGQKILRSEVDKYFNNQTADAPQKPAGEQAVSLRLDILNQLIQQAILMQRAQKLNLVASDDEVESKLTEFKAPYTQEEFEKRLKAKNLTQSDLKDEFRRDLTIQKLFNKEVNSKINITDADIRSFYEAHKAEFNLIEPHYHIAQIWVGSQPGAVRNRKNSKAQNDTEARAKVQMIINRLDSGDDFATLAMDYSEDPESSANGGDMGMWPESSLKQTDAATREALSRMKAGQVSPAIPVNAGAQGKGYRIVQLIAKEPAGQRELTDPRVQQAIREQLRQRLEQLLKTAYYEVARNDAKVENYYADEILKNPASVGK